VEAVKSGDMLSHSRPLQAQEAESRVSLKFEF